MNNYPKELLHVLGTIAMTKAHDLTVSVAHGNVANGNVASFKTTLADYLIDAGKMTGQQKPAQAAGLTTQKSVGTNDRKQQYAFNSDGIVSVSASKTETLKQNFVAQKDNIIRGQFPLSGTSFSTPVIV